MEMTLPSLNKTLNRSPIRIFHQNICGVKSNGELLEIHLQCESPDIVCLSEHNLTNEQFTSFLLSGYSNVSAFCRKERQKGGVCILANEKLHFEHVDVSKFCDEHTCQLSAAKFKLHSDENLLVVAVYRIPGYHCQEFMDHINDCLGSIMKKSIKTVVIGDFNIDVLGDKSSNKEFINLMNTYGLRYTISTFTREFKGSKSAIDNIFTNISDDLIKSSVVVTAMTDHHAQEAEIGVPAAVANVPRFREARKFSDENVQCLRFNLQKESWDDVFSASNLDDKFNAFFNTLKFHFDVCFPIKKLKINDSHFKLKVPLTKEILNFKDRLTDLYSLSKDLDSSHPLRLDYRRVKRLYRKKIADAKSEVALKMINSSSNKSKSIWNIVNGQKPTKHEKSPNISVLDRAGGVVVDPSRVANTFNELYSTIGQRLASDSAIPISPFTSSSNAHHPSCNSSLFLTKTTESEVLQVIIELKAKSSHGYDGMSSRLVKQISDLICSPLTHLINTSLKDGTFPSVLKHAIVRPLFKKGKRDDVNNYRPISLVPTFSKIFEKIFLYRLTSFIKHNDILSPSQFGFIKDRNTADAIHFMVSSLSQALDSGRATAGIYFDLSKAFDTVDHSLLLEKLYCLGLRGVAYSWIESYLSGRSQSVQVPFVDRFNCFKWASSSTSMVKQGVPQGSVLGPILFILFINDLPHCISGDGAKICLFADDTSLSVSAVTLEALRNRASVEVNSILQWFNNNKLFLNGAKTQLIEFHLLNSKNNAPLEIPLNDSLIQSGLRTKFLGVHIDSQLKFSAHVDSVCNKLSSSIFLLRRLANFMEPKVLLVAYYGVVYPFLSYAVAVWGYECGRTHQIFKLQKKAIRIIFKKTRSFPCRTIFINNRILSFPSIYILNCVVFVKKNFHLFQEKPSTHLYGLRRRLDLAIPEHKTSFFKNQLLYNGVRLFNALPMPLKEQTDADRFAKEVKELLLKLCPYSIRDFVHRPT